jgi:hypothetical protein
MAGRKQPELSLNKTRSAITNGRHLLPEIDARSSWMRRLRDLVSLHVADLGGSELVSESELRLVRRAAMLTIQTELLDAKFASEGGQASQNDLECYQRVTNTLRRCLETLGLSRRSKDVTPTLEQYIRAKALQEEQRP